MEKIYQWIISGLMGAALIVGISMAADFTNPNPQSGSDTAGQLLLKHESNMTDLYAPTTGKLNLLKNNFVGGGSPSSPGTGQGWYDSTNKLFQIYDGTWGAGGIFSSGTSSFSGGIFSRGSNTWSGTQRVKGDINSSGTNTLSGTQNITGSIISSGDNTFTGTNIFSEASSSGTITANKFVGPLIGNVTGTVDNASGTGTAVYAGETGLKIIRGTVAANGTILAGTGFTVSRPGAPYAGTYLITFNSTFSGQQSSISVSGGSSTTINSLDNAGLGVSGVSTMVVIRDVSGFIVDGVFTFITIGPK